MHFSIVESTLRRLYEELKVKGVEGVTKEAKSIVGGRLERAIVAVREMRVKKYVFASGRVVWVVVGDRQDYFLVPFAYCSCYDFYTNVMVRGTTVSCYHLLALTIALATGEYEEVKVDSGEEEKRILRELTQQRELI